MVIIKKASINYSKQIKSFIDSISELEITENTFSLNYIKRLINKGIVLIAISDKKIIGACFGTYNTSEKWSDLLGIAVCPHHRMKGTGTLLLKQFEKQIKYHDIRSIDLYSNISSVKFYEKNGFNEGNKYVSFRKQI